MRDALRVGTLGVHQPQQGVQGAESKPSTLRIQRGARAPCGGKAR